MSAKTCEWYYAAGDSCQTPTEHKRCKRHFDAGPLRVACVNPECDFRTAASSANTHGGKCGPCFRNYTYIDRLCLSNGHSLVDVEMMRALRHENDALA